MTLPIDRDSATASSLTDRRLVTMSAGGEESTVDLGHEAMITHWPTLGHWIEESRAGELARRRIERDSEEWQRNGRDPGELYRRRKLSDALKLASEHQYELSQNSARFLAAGRRRRLLDRLGWGVMAAAALASVWLVIPPVRDVWLKHEAAALSPQVRLAGGRAIVGPGRRRVTFPQLLVDIHEVSNQQYRYCVEAQQCSAPAEPADDAHYADGDRDLPVVWVTAYDAVRFCSWLGRRLPTESEWERIARGTDGAAYRWGNAPPKQDQANIILGNHQPAGLVPVGSATFRSGDSRDGVEQLIGNAREWTATRSRYGARHAVVLLGNWNERDRVPLVTIIGGGYQDDAANVQSSLVPGDPSSADGETGFRCVATA